VQRGVRVYKKRRTEETEDDGDVGATVGFWGALREALSDLPAAIVRGPSGSDFESWIGRVVTWPFVKPLYIMLAPDDSYTENKRVGTFYPTDWVTGSKAFSISLVVAITVAFGGIHCVGWSFTFPSTVERTVWRVASLMIVCIPVVLLPIAAFGIIIGRFVLFVNMTTLSVLFLYLLGRLALLVLPVLCLRSLPPAAFHVVHWTSFIPHI